MPHLRHNGTSLFFEQSGAGPDLVWCAAGDMPGASWHRWQLPAFTAWRNTTWDARGVGATSTDAPEPWSIADHAGDCIALIEHACTPPVTLVGLSMGSCICQEVALTRPDLVEQAVLMGACPRKSGFIAEWEAAEIALRRAGRTLPADFSIVHYALLMYPASVLGDDDAWAAVRPVVAADYGQRDPQALAAQWQACLEYDSLDRLPGCRVPLHVVAFSEDVQTPPAHGRRIADTAPRGSFTLLDGLGHGSLFGHRPDTVNECLLGLLAGLPGQGG